LKKIGCFPGTFDPMHFGHLNLIDFFIKETDLDEIWIIITPLNPFKSKCLTTKEERFKMVELSLSNKKDVKISKIEFLLDKPYYTINTLRELSEKYPENKFVLLIGEDNLYRFNKWKNYQEILESYMLYVYPRKSDFSIPEYIKTHPSIKFFKAPKIKNSSSQIRKKIAKNINVTNFIHPKVYQYIKENKIYIK
jgi:nicotinate-nucleotide adenylyltransferase